MAKVLEYDVKVKGTKEAEQTLGEFEKKAESKTIDLKVGVDTKKISEALHKLEERTKSLFKVGEGIAGGFAVATGVVGAFGDEIGLSAEQIEEAQKKAESFVAILMGVQKTAEGAKEAFKLMNSVLLSNPLGLIVTTIGLLVAGLALLGEENEKSFFVLEKIENVTDQVQKKVKLLTAAEYEQAKALKEETDRRKDVTTAGVARNAQLQDELFLLKRAQTQIQDKFKAEIIAAQLAGKTGEQINKLRREENAELEKNLILQAEVLKTKIDNAILIAAEINKISAAQARQLILDDAVYGQILINAEKRLEDFGKQIQDINEAQRAHYEEVARAQKEANEKIKEGIKAGEEAASAEYEFGKIVIETEQQKLQAKIDISQAEADLEAQRLAEHQYANDLTKLSDQRSYDDRVAALQQLFEEGKIFEDEYNKYVAQAAETRHQERVKETQKGLAATQSYFSSISQINDLVNTIQANGLKKGEELTTRQLKRQFVRQQALAITQSLINGAQGVTKAIAEFGPPPSPAGIAGILSAAAITGLQVAAIASKKFEGAGSGPGSALNTNVSAPAGQTPDTRSIAFNQRPQIDVAKNSTIKVAVLQSDIKDTFNKVDVAQSLAHFG